MSKRTRTYAERKDGAFHAGLAAAKDGKALTDCTILKHQGLARAWKEGWLSGNAEREKQTSGMNIAKGSSSERPASAPLAAHG
jgi:hypothetical protein